MTEAVRPTGASMHPSAGAISGEVLMTPISLAHAINVTSDAPKPSRSSIGNLSHDMMGGPSLREKAAALTLALGMLGGAKLVFDSQSAKGQSPSPVPSEEPITGAVDPCASPEPSPSPSPTPEPTTLIGMANNSNGETVVVTLPQAAPASNAAEASEAPASFVPVDRNGDGVIDEKDTETAAVDPCEEPEPTPTPSAAPTEAPTEKVSIVDSTVNKIVKREMNQIKPIKIGALEIKVRSFWEKYEEELSGYQVPGSTGGAYSLEHFNSRLSDIKLGPENSQGENTESLRYIRRVAAASLTRVFILLADQTPTKELRKASLKLAYNTFDYGVAGIDQENNEKDLKEMRYNLKDMFAGS